VEKLSQTGKALDEELKALLSYYGEVPDGSESLKPEDFFGLIMSFSSALQVSSKN